MNIKLEELKEKREELVKELETLNEQINNANEHIMFTRGKINMVDEIGSKITDDDIEDK
jgi:predicted nuclease with TOPRIM domain